MSDDNQDIDDPVDDDAFDALVAELPDALRDPSVWAEPPPWLAESIVVAIAAERDEPRSAPVARPPAPARRARRPRQIWWLAAAAAIVAIVPVGVVVTRGGDDTGTALAIEGTELAPDASATAIVTELGAGVEIELAIEGLPPAPEGFFYQGWVRSEDGDLVTIGTFHVRDGDSTVTLWSGVEVAGHPTLTVTLQQDGAGPESSGEVVLRGSLLP